MTHAEPLSQWMTWWLVASLFATLVITALSFTRNWARSERELENAERVMAKHQESTQRFRR